MAEPLRLKLLCDREMAYWGNQFINNPDYGWTKNIAALARVLGYHSNRPGGTLKKRCAYIDWPTTEMERHRFSIGVRRILAGEVVLRQRKNSQNRWCWYETTVNPPQPPQVKLKDPFYIDWADLKLKRRA